MTYAIAYLGTAIVFFAIDLVWLSIAVKHIYQPLLGDMLKPSPDLAVAGLFYVVYVVGVVVLAVMPAVTGGSFRTALLLGGLLGLVAYGTYDMTNLATLKGWPVTVAIIDTAWGTALTAVSAGAGYFAVRLLGYGG